MHNIILKQLIISPLLILFIFTSPLLAQNLNFDIHINAYQIERTSLSYLNNFDEKIETYLNGYDWTINDLQTQERVKTDIQIILTSVSPNYTFTANLIIRSVRTVDNLARQTTLFLYHDDSWKFQYIPNQSLIHNELQFGAITTLLNFYANLILGYNYDSFKALGGTPYFVEAQEQASIAQASSSSGWQRSRANSNNRVQLIADLTNPNYELFRKAFYHYHRGLALFRESPENARKNIFEALKMIRQTKQQTVNNLLFDLFFNAKHLEIVSIFKEAPSQMRSKIFNLLSKTDVSHLNIYRTLQ